MENWHVFHFEIKCVQTTLKIELSNGDILNFINIAEIIKKTFILFL